MKIILPNNPIFWVKPVGAGLFCLALFVGGYSSGTKHERLKWLEKDARQTQEIDRLRKEKEARAYEIDQTVEEKKREANTDNITLKFNQLFDRTSQ